MFARQRDHIKEAIDHLKLPIRGISYDCITLGKHLRAYSLRFSEGVCSALVGSIVILIRNHISIEVRHENLEHYDGLYAESVADELGINIKIAEEDHDVTVNDLVNMIKVFELYELHELYVGDFYMSIPTSYARPLKPNFEADKYIIAGDVKMFEEALEIYKSLGPKSARK